MITANFGADFTKFTLAVEKAEVTLRSFEDNSVKVEKALARIGNAYSGQRLVQEATLTAEAIERIGGTTKLTTTELQRAGTMAEEAIAKMRALGMDVPDRLQKLADAAKPIPERLTLAARAADLAKSSFGQMFAAFNAASLVQSAVSSLINFGTAAVDAAGKTVDLADKLGVSTDAIQTWDFVAKQTGTTVDAFASSAFKLQTRLAGAGGKGPIVDALDNMGLSLQRLKALAPEQQFDTVVAALSRMENGAERNRLGVLLFGKQFEQMAPAVAAGYQQLADAATKTSRANLQALDAMGDAWTAFTGQATSATQTVLGRFAVLGQEVAKQEGFWMKWGTAMGLAVNPARMKAAIDAYVGESERLAKAQAQQQAQQQATTDATEDYAVALKAARAEVAALTPAQRDQLDAALAIGKGTEAAARLFTNADAALAVYNAQIKTHVKDTKDATAEAEKAAEAAKKWDASYRGLSATFSRFSEQLDGHGAQMRTTIDFYATMPASIASIGDSLRSDFIPATQMSADALMQLATVGQTSMTSLKTGITSQNVSGALAKTGDSMGKGLTTGLAKGVMQLGPTILSATTGGGNVAASVGGVFGSTMGESLSKGAGKAVSSVLGKTIGGAIGSIIPGLGTMIGSIAGGFIGKGLGALFGKSEHEKVNDMRDAAFKAAGGFEKMNEQAHRAGTTLKSVLDARTVTEYEAAVAQLQGTLGEFANEQAADQARLQAAIEKYGFSLAELGPQLQSARLDEQAKELIEDWRVLAAAGIDVSTVNAKMAESINAYLQAALAVGAEVPAAMRPVLESMAAQGTLVDANGEAITDLEASGIKFSESMTQGFDRVVKKLDELIGKLQAAGSAISSIPTTVDVGVNYHANTPPGPPSGGEELPGFASGTRGRFLDFGRGTPVMLHGREAVVPAAEAGGGSAILATLARLPAEISRAVQRGVSDALVLAPRAR